MCSGIGNGKPFKHIELNIGIIIIIYRYDKIEFSKIKN